MADDLTVRSLMHDKTGIWSLSIDENKGKEYDITSVRSHTAMEPDGGDEPDNPRAIMDCVRFHT